MVLCSIYGSLGHTRGLNLNSEHAVMQIVVSVGRACDFYWYLSFFAWIMGFCSFVISRDVAWFWAFMRSQEHARRLNLNQSTQLCRLMCPLVAHVDFYWYFVFCMSHNIFGRLCVFGFLHGIWEFLGLSRCCYCRRLYVCTCQSYMSAVRYTITCGGPALRVHRAETMVDGLPRAASFVHEKLLRTRDRMTSSWAKTICAFWSFLDIAPQPPVQIAWDFVCGEFEVFRTLGRKSHVPENFIEKSWRHGQVRHMTARITCEILHCIEQFSEFVCIRGG